MWPKVSVSLTKKQFLFIPENVHASKSFCKIYPLNTGFTVCAQGMNLPCIHQRFVHLVRLVPLKMVHLHHCPKIIIVMHFAPHKQVTATKHHRHAAFYSKKHLKSLKLIRQHKKFK